MCFWLFFGFFFGPSLKFTLTHNYIQGEGKTADLYSNFRFLPWNSPNLHISVVGVHYCKGSYRRIKQLPQKITVIWHTQTF